jgi:hypothetical protein
MVQSEMCCEGKRLNLRLKKGERCFIQGNSHPLGPNRAEGEKICSCMKVTFLYLSEKCEFVWHQVRRDV